MEEFQKEKPTQPGNTSDIMDAIVVGRSYHFWLCEEDAIYDDWESKM